MVASVLLFNLTSHADSISYIYGAVVRNGGWTDISLPFWDSTAFPASVLHTVNTWAWCLTVFAWAAKYLNKPSRRLAYFNQSVYPFYIVHQTIILVVLWYVRSWNLWWPIKLLGLTAVTFAGCWATFEVMKRTKLTRALFGIKPLRYADQPDSEIPTRRKTSGHEGSADKATTTSA